MLTEPLVEPRSDPQPIPRLGVDIFSRYMDMTDQDDTPLLFRKWSVISMIGGALERRVWTVTGSRSGNPRYTYPNLYVMLLGAPGTGKGVIDDVRNFWTLTKDPNSSEKTLHVAPNNMTKAALLDELADARRTFLPPKGETEEYSCLLVPAEELSVFLPQYDQAFLGTLNELYVGKPEFKERRRYGKKELVSLDKPILSIITGAQPAWLASSFPEDAWSTGFMSRMIMIYATSVAKISPFATGKEAGIEHRLFQSDLNGLSMLHGRVEWEYDARVRLTDWHLGKDDLPVPDHSKLETYLNRRLQHATKLCMIASISRTRRVATVELQDVERALAWLVEAERYMPDGFRAMLGRSDHQLLEELYRHVLGLYNMAKCTPIHVSKLVHFLSMRCPSDKVQGLVDIAEKSGMVDRIGGTDCYKPKPRTEWGAE